ncbi:flagellar biosynthetic protein FliO [Paenibacillus sp. GCM10027626]|uniref:flagellar biosynthetic protein FliO n=1 Tax=Paenibacillus sp. GCM10027626 TaxID=3273411 RepID=UPI003630C15E
MKQRLILKLAGLGSFFWLMAGAVAAANPVLDDSPPEIPRADTNIAGSLIWVVFALLLVIVLIVVVIRWLAQRNRSWGANRSLRSMGGIPLGQNKSLQVVEVAGRIYVVGVGDNVALLDKIDDADEVERMLAQLEQQSGGAWKGGAWKDAFSRWRNQSGQDDQPDAGQWQQSASFQSMLEQRLGQQSDRKKKVEQLLKEQKQDDRLMDE